MNAERVREFCLGLPHVLETRQWGDSLLFWVGDKAIGGKMMAVVDLGPGDKGVIWYAADAERYAELVEVEGILPAPYLARLGWVAVEGWGVHRDKAWEEELRAAHTVTLAKLTPKTLGILALPSGERKRVVAERKKVLAEREALKAAKSAKGKK